MSSLSSSSSSPGWIQPLTGQNEVTVHTVEIQKKEAIEPFPVNQDNNNPSTIGTNHWTKKALYVGAREKQDWEEKYERKQGESVKEFRMRIAAEQAEMKEVKDPKVLHYDDGGVSATHSSHGCNFFNTFYQAYNHHGEVVLSPDDVWTMVQLSLSRYINSKPETSERLRSLFVDFQGKKEIIVKIPAPVGGEYSLGEKWNKFTRATCEKMTELMQKDVVNDVVGKFSSTRPFDTFVSQTIVMDCFQAFFEYTMRFSCGISKVHFLGTLEDWNLLPVKLAGLRKYEGEKGDGSWTQYVDNLVPVFTKFAETFAGRVDSSWWNGVIDERHARGYGSGAPAELSGWILRFYYGLGAKVEDTEDMTEMFARVPVTIDDHDIRIIKVKIFTGFSGITIASAENCAEDPRRQVFRPHKSLAVILECPSDDQPKTEPEGWYIAGDCSNYETEVIVRPAKRAKKINEIFY